MNRTHRRQMVDRLAPFPANPGRSTAIFKEIHGAFAADLEDPYMCQVPDVVLAVWSPLEKIIDQIETEGTVDTDAATNKIIFACDGKYHDDAIEAMGGVVAFHDLARTRHRINADTGPLARFAKKLEYGTPITEYDIKRVRESIAACKTQAMSLRRSEAISIVDDIRIAIALEAEMNRLKGRAA